MAPTAALLNKIAVLPGGDSPGAFEMPVQMTLIREAATAGDRGDRQPLIEQASGFAELPLNQVGMRR